MIKYSIVTFPDPEQLVKAVNGEILEGWQIYGNVSTAFDVHDRQWFTQVLVKEEPRPVTE